MTAILDAVLNSRVSIKRISGDFWYVIYQLLSTFPEIFRLLPISSGLGLFFNVNALGLCVGHWLWAGWRWRHCRCRRTVDILDQIRNCSFARSTWQGPRWERFCCAPCILIWKWVWSSSSCLVWIINLHVDSHDITRICYDPLRILLHAYVVLMPNGACAASRVPAQRVHVHQWFSDQIRSN